MTTPSLTCEHCESEIDVAKDPDCVIYNPSGATDVYCAECRKRYRWQETTPLDREAYRIKRGWRA